LKAALLILLSLISSLAQAIDTPSCKGSVLQRRFALVQFGRMVDAYIATKGALPDICSEPVAGISDVVPDLLNGALVCGSSKEGSVYYSCQIPPVQSGAPTGTPSDDAPVIESCRYSLVDQSVSCENRSVMTIIEG
jgi:hypothetical protein